MRKGEKYMRTVRGHTDTPERKYGGFSAAETLYSDYFTIPFSRYRRVTKWLRYDYKNKRVVLNGIEQAAGAFIKHS